MEYDLLQITKTWLQVLWEGVPDNFVNFLRLSFTVRIPRPLSVLFYFVPQEDSHSQAGSTTHPPIVNVWKSTQMDPNQFKVKLKIHESFPVSCL